MPLDISTWDKDKIIQLAEQIAGLPPEEWDQIGLLTLQYN